MGNRITRVYTRTGDGGTTGLGDGSRVEKDNPRVTAMGGIDELNSLIGLLLTEVLPEPVQAMLINIQHELFDVGGEISMPGTTVLTAAAVEQLENQLDTMNNTLEPLKEFILPGGSRAAATCHLARSVCRRAESLLVTASGAGPINPQTLKYLNRLSDLLFVTARYINKQAGNGDVLWQRLEHRTNPD
jgi:cob(I)alamin adenosyltransferase